MTVYSKPHSPEGGMTTIDRARFAVAGALTTPGGRVVEDRVFRRHRRAVGRLAEGTTQAPPISGNLELVDALRVAGGTGGSEWCLGCKHPCPQRVALLHGGLDTEIFALVSSVATPEEWADWLRVPLEHAAARGNLGLVDKLLKAGANGGAGWRGCRDRTLLDAAALDENADIGVSALMGAGAGPDVNVVSVSSKRSALYTTTCCGHDTCARRLIEAGADVNFKALSSGGCSVLHSAIEGGHEQLVNDLLDSGADADTRRGLSGFTALHIAAYAGHGGSVSAFLRRR